MTVEEESLLTTIVEQVYFKPILLAVMEEMVKCERSSCGRLLQCSSAMNDRHKRHVHQEKRASKRRINPKTLADKTCCPYKNETTSFWNIKLVKNMQPPKSLLTVCQKFQILKF